MLGLQQDSVNGFLLFSPPHSGFSLPWGKKRKTLLRDQGRLDGRQLAWEAGLAQEGLGRMGEQRHTGGQIPGGSSPTSRRRTRAPVVPVTLRRARTRRAALTEQAAQRTRTRAPARWLCKQWELFSPSGQEPGRGARGEEAEGTKRKGTTAHFHWWPVGVAPAVGTRHSPFGGYTSGKERKRRAGGGGVKMAAPLRIQNDWAQALR